MHRTSINPKKGTRLTRQGRYSCPGQIYHVIATTNDRKPRFIDVATGRCVVKTLIRMASEDYATTLAYVVMPDHLHWLMQLRRSKSLSVCVGNVKSHSARMLNEMENRSGPVWTRGFFERAVRRDQDIVVAARYIVANPLRAELVEHIGDYPLWDSIWMG